jgi:hypothetical protein
MDTQDRTEPFVGELGNGDEFSNHLCSSLAMRTDIPVIGFRSVGEAEPRRNEASFRARAR